MLVLHDRILTVKPFPPDAAREAAAAAAEKEGADGYDEEEAYGRLTPVQAVGFRSQVTESDDGEVRCVKGWITFWC